jgi:Putative DNA-binding domain
MDLRDLQLALQEHVLHGAPAIVARVRRSVGLDASARLAIYANAYTLRLAEALREGFPALARTVGPAAFDAMAREYIAAHPSRHASIRWFGAQLAAHLQAHGPAGLADIARWEWVLGTAFDGPDAAPVGLAAATSVAAGDWATLRIAFCSNVQRIAVRADAVQAWRLAKSGASESLSTGHDAAIEWLVWRRDLVTTFRSLSSDEAWAFDAARDGARFSELCEGLASRVGEEEAAALAASLLKQWLTDGCVAALTCEPA